jgi:hypothetical protein
MKLNITKRDIKFFFLGVLALFLIDLAWNWDQNWKDMKNGWKDGAKAAKAEETYHPEVK